MSPRFSAASTVLLPLLLTAAVTTGPEIGTKLPSFSAPDQDGKVHTLASLMGPKGLVLVVFRSADW